MSGRRRAEPPAPPIPSQPAGGRPVRFRTRTGSVYEVDNEALTWRRVSTTLASGNLRSESGHLIRPATVRLGHPVVMFGPPFEGAVGLRRLETTPVVSIEHPRGESGDQDAPEANKPVGFEFSDVSFRDVRVGDRLTRMFSRGAFPDQFVVTHLDDRFIYCGKPGLGWKFDRDHGIEVDEELGFGPEFGLVATWLIHPRRAGQGDA